MRPSSSGPVKAGCDRRLSLRADAGLPGEVDAGLISEALLYLDVAEPDAASFPLETEGSMRETIEASFDPVTRAK